MQIPYYYCCIFENPSICFSVLIFNPSSYSVNFFYDSHWIFSVNCRVLPSINKASYHDVDDGDDDDDDL